jgi:hypothetical protein
LWVWHTFKYSFTRERESLKICHFGISVVLSNMKNSGSEKNVKKCIQCLAQLGSGTYFVTLLEELWKSVCVHGWKHFYLLLLHHLKRRQNQLDPRVDVMQFSYFPVWIHIPVCFNKILWFDYSLWWNVT